MAGLSMKQPLKAARVRTFVQALKAVNQGWCDQLDDSLRGALRKFPKTCLGKNGADFLDDDNRLSQTLFAYGLIQSMLPTVRRDPKHFDGGCSLVHMGLTIFGSRSLELFWKSAGGAAKHDHMPLKIMTNQPGSVYVGNLVAVEHQVLHKEAGASAVPLFRADDRAPGVEIAVMVRCDPLRHSYSRQLTHAPSPADVFSAVNRLTAAHLASHPLQMPSFDACVSRMERDEEPFRAAASSYKRLKVSCS